MYNLVCSKLYLIKIISQFGRYRIVTSILFMTYFDEEQNAGGEEQSAAPAEGGEATE